MADVLTGRIRVGDEPDAVFVGSDVLAQELADYVKRELFVCWAISAEPIGLTDLLTANIMQASGVVEAEYSVAYSEVTGYLWTDEEGVVGGHDLVAIFREAVGKYGVVVISEEPIDLTLLVAASAQTLLPPEARTATTMRQMTPTPNAIQPSR